jgi:signal transduction histidine kinase
MKRINNLSRKQTGDTFELKVAELYRAMGFEVSLHTPVCGQEVDILAARHIPGSGSYSVIVECKYKGGNRLAGNADVQSIAGAFNIAKVNHIVAACTVVTTTGFSLAAQEAAKAAGIHLTTYSELIKNLIDFTYYFKTLKTRFIESFGDGNSTWFIKARGRQGKSEIKLLDELVDSWLARKRKSPLALLGGYGTGKTSFCNHYAVRLINKPGSPIPIILSLREFQKSIKIESLVRDFLDEQCNAPAPRFDTFWRMYSEGLILLILDGFDEMAIRVDASVLEANLLEIERFGRTTGNLILTCRPEVFITDKEEISALRPSNDPLSERMSVYEQVELELWTTEQVSQYVEKRVRGMKPRPRNPPDFYLERIKKLPELNDLSTRAVHLDLIVKLLPSMIENSVPITRPNLYQTYIQRELRRETVHNKRLQIMSDESRLSLMRTVAAERFLKSYDNLNFEEASTIIKSKLGLPISEVESVTRDFLNRSFLRREGDIYWFAHKSLGEYLFAVEVHEKIVGGELEFLKRTNCSSAVAGMVLDLFGGFEGFDSMLAALNLQSRGTHFVIDELEKIGFVANSLADYAKGIQAIARGRKFSGTRTDLYWRQLGGWAHDLNNLLVAVRGYHDLIIRLSQLENSSREERHIKELSTAWSRLLSHTMELHQFQLNRLTFNLEFKLRRKEVDLGFLLDNSVTFIQKDKVQITGGCRPYFGDENLLSRIFENLALNAKYAIEENGNLIVNLSETSDDEVQITFTNTGSTIPSDVIDKIFDWGFTTRRDGHGIGLAVVKELIELHNGSIKVRSNAQKTIFEILLPRS